MSDDDGGWDDDDYEVPDLTTLVVKTATADDKFADEDAETAEEIAAREAKARADGAVRAAQRAREKAKAAVKTSVAYDDDALDDPVAEKARRQRLVEEADLRAAKELFGDAEVKLDEFEPKSKGEFEKFGSAIAYKYLTSRSESGFYTAGLKALLRVAMRDLTAAEAKDVETQVVTTRTEKVKKEKADAEAAKKLASGSKKGKGKFLNAGSKGGDSGLDDYKYDVASPDDDYDFM
jgi:translation initiation factor 3 subunit J